MLKSIIKTFLIASSTVLEYFGFWFLGMAVYYYFISDGGNFSEVGCALWAIACAPLAVSFRLATLKALVSGND